MEDTTVVEYRTSRTPIEFKAVSLGDGTFALASVPPTQDSKIDVVDGSTTYIGVAPVGTAASFAGWQIVKKTVSGSITSFRYAGTGAFDQVWNDRLSLVYGA